MPNDPGPEQLRKIRYVGFDFDGVFTDNRVYVSETGQEMVVCTRSDGIGLEELRKVGVDFAIFSTEVNPVVQARARKLKTECHSGLERKVERFLSVLKAKGISPIEAAFVGNDLNDLECLKAVGLAVVPRDAHPDVVGVAGMVLEKNGGQGAVRELCDRIVRAHS